MWSEKIREKRLSRSIGSVLNIAFDQCTVEIDTTPAETTRIPVNKQMEGEPAGVPCEVRRIMTQKLENLLVVGYRNID